MFFSNILLTTPSSIVLSPPPQQQLVGRPTRERNWMERRGSGIVWVAIVDGLRSLECHCDGGHYFAFVLCRSSEEKWGDDVSISLVVDDINSLMSNLTTTRCPFFYFYSKRVAARVAQPDGIIHFPRRPRLDELVRRPSETIPSHYFLSGRSKGARN